ncbi:hypothetical protein K439DRAFT_1611528 [Ramaria rubella]|nr:hypothetical protein K439DRAFT_1611528 [Ramaria rubella]
MQLDLEERNRKDHMELDAQLSPGDDTHIHMGEWHADMLALDPENDFEASFDTEIDEALGLPCSSNSLLPFEPPDTPSGYSSEISSPAAPGPDGRYSCDRMDSDLGTEGAPQQIPVQPQAPCLILGDQGFAMEPQGQFHPAGLAFQQGSDAYDIRHKLQPTRLQGKFFIACDLPQLPDGYAPGKFCTRELKGYCV